MTNQEALLRFNVAYDAIASLSAPPLVEAEISSFMNTSMMELITTFANARAFDKLLEITRIEKTGIVACTLESCGSYAYQSSNSLSLPFLYFVNSHLLISSRTTLVTINNEWIPCEQVAKNDAWFFIQSPMNQQIILHPKVLIHYNDSTNEYTPIIFTDKHTVVALSTSKSVLVFEIVYIREPAAIDLDGTVSSELCELSEEAQELIVKRAVKLATIATDQDRLKMGVDNSQQQQKQRQQAE